MIAFDLSAQEGKREAFFELLGTKTVHQAALISEHILPECESGAWREWRPFSRQRLQIWNDCRYIKSVLSQETLPAAERKTILDKCRPHLVVDVDHGHQGLIGMKTVGGNGHVFLCW